MFCCCITGIPVLCAILTILYYLSYSGPDYHKCTVLTMEELSTVTQAVIIQNTLLACNTGNTYSLSQLAVVITRITGAYGPLKFYQLRRACCLSCKNVLFTHILLILTINIIIATTTCVKMFVLQCM